MASLDEVYCAYGCAARAAQMFESNLAICLHLLESLPGTSAERFAKDALNIEELFLAVRKHVDSKPLGVLLKMLEKHSLFDGEQGDLRKMLETRNRLIHGYFGRNEDRLESEEGREQLVSELHETANQLLTITQMVQEVGPDRAQAIGARSLLDRGVPINVLADLHLKR